MFHLDQQTGDVLSPYVRYSRIRRKTLYRSVFTPFRRVQLQTSPDAYATILRSRPREGRLKSDHRTDFPSKNRQVVWYEVRTIKRSSSLNRCRRTGCLSVVTKKGLLTHGIRLLPPSLFAAPARNLHNLHPYNCYRQCIPFVNW